MIKEALCIDTADFAWSGDGKALLPIEEGDIAAMKPRLVDRAICETDESTLQLLPYNALVNEHGEIFCYIRGVGGQEDRLHAKLSVGIGGHVDVGLLTKYTGYEVGEEPPKGAWTMSLDELLKDEAAREIREEVGLTGPIYTNFTHYIVDLTNPVGRVHLGLLSVNHIAAADLGELEAGMVLDGTWVSVDYLASELIYARLENWSQLVVDHLRRQQHSGKNVECMEYTPPVEVQSNTFGIKIVDPGTE